MKERVTIIIAILAIITLVIAIECKSKTPMDRYLDTTQSSSQICSSTGENSGGNYIPREIINDEGNLKYEFLSYDLIDDKNIAKQTKYKDDYFVEGKVPPADYVVKDTDYDAMARDYPKYDEYRRSNCEKGMTQSEYEEFMREHKADYTTDKHIKTKYIFVRCRITYVGGGRRDEYLHTFDVFVMRGNTLLDYYGMNCYFDHPQRTNDEARESLEFFRYKFEKVGDSIECILGCRITGEYIDLSEDNEYYIGFQPSVTYSDYEQFNPAIDSRCIAIADMPMEQ